MPSACTSCKVEAEAWNERCGGCGFRLVLEPDEAARARFLRGPSLGALLWTQGWTFGARLYVWFLASLVPVVGFVVLFACLLFGRRWSWKYGGWADWDEFRARMRLLDAVALVWLAGIAAGWYVLRGRV
jgi:hypothetical protein